MKTIFNKKLIKKNFNISWGTKMLLWFCKSQYSTDFGYEKDNNVILQFKKLRGKYYVISEDNQEQKGER